MSFFFQDERSDPLLHIEVSTGFIWLNFWMSCFLSSNGVIKRIVYKACGYNDLDYLYLKIRQEGQK